MLDNQMFPFRANPLETTFSVMFSLSRRGVTESIL